MSLVEDLTVLIDYPKYRRVQNQRAQRQLNPWNKLNVSGPFGRTGSLFPLPWFPSSPQQPAKDRSKDDCDGKKDTHKLLYSNEQQNILKDNSI